MNRERNRRNLIVGAISLAVIAALFALGWHLQTRQKADDRRTLAAADAAMARGIAGDCGAFARAQAGYVKVMQHYLQNKDLVGKAQIANDLAKLCGHVTATELQNRELVAVATKYAPAELTALALAQLAVGNREAALFTLARLPDDPLCQWLSGWLRSIPPVPKR